jgi:hypothetical protein
MSETTSAPAETLTIGLWLEQLIERMSDPVARAEMAAKYGDRWSLCLCADDKEPKKSWAEVRYQTAQGILVLESFSHGPRRLSDKMQRVCELPLKAILVCGELLEDSKAKMASRP